VILKDIARTLVEIIKLKGIEDVDQEHIFDLLQKLDPKTRKKVEEVIKHE